MIQPTTLHELATTPDKRTYLQTLLKQITGSKQRKEALLRAGGIDHLLSLLSPPNDPKDGELEASIAASAVLAALSLPTDESVRILHGTSSTSNAYELAAGAFVKVFISYPATGTPSPLYQKQLDAQLRALKTLFVDFVSTVSSLGDLGHMQTQKGGKGKEKEGDVEMSDRDQSNDEDLSQILAIIYCPSAASTSASTVPGSSSSSPPPAVTQLSPTLDALLELLVDASQPDHPVSRMSGTSQRMRIADHVCTLLSRTIQSHNEQQAIAAGEKGTETIAALRRLVESGSEKVQEGALNALTAIVRDSHVALLSVLELGGSGSTAERLKPFLALAQSPTPSVRLAAISFYAVASKLQPSSSIVVLDPAILLSLIEKELTLRGSAAHAFAYLVAKDPEAQVRAALSNCFDVFRRVLDSIPSLADTSRTGTSDGEDTKTREGILISLDSLIADSETNRRLLLDAKVLPHVLESLNHPVVAIRAASCRVVRALSRSVNVLRTDLVEAHAEGSLIQLLRAEEDEEVQTTATAVFANLLLEFSPMRKVLVDAGCIPRLCRLALESENLQLKQNALWAIKNAVYQSPKIFKTNLLEDLTWNDLAAFMNPKQNPLFIEQALGIVRNLTCVNHNEFLDVFDNYGEDEVLDILQEHLLTCGDVSFEAVIQSLYCLNNIATVSEATQLAIASRTPILRYLIFYLDHSSGRVRTAALWAIQNLVYRRNLPLTAVTPRQRRSNEVVEKLRVLGLDAKLRTLERDSELDVRERVRDIKEAM